MREVELKLPSGWPVLFAWLFGLAITIVLYILAGSLGLGWLGLVTTFLLLSLLIGAFGFIVNSPNQARVVLLLGRYVGTLRDVGFFYGNPLYRGTRVSLRVQTFETGQMDTAEQRDAAGKVAVAAQRHRHPSKVNDKDGTPIEIAAVVVWRVVNTAEAVFQVDDYKEFVHIQSEAALRNLASQYVYDNPDETVHSLRSHTAEVAERLKVELHDRLRLAGVEIEEARISYLAYASEIAAAMLKRQQATAVVAARFKIVEGAVGMVEEALTLLAQKQLLELDAERKAAMVSNLLVVLCADRDPQPVLNTGTIYQ